MRNETRIRERYLADRPAVRLGGLAANLARISSFAEEPDDIDAVDSLLSESIHFIKWTVMDCPPATRTRLVDLGIQLAGWHKDLADTLASCTRRDALRREARTWSEEVLRLSGLLNRGSESPTP
jgi:hypothetical protein